MARSPVQSLAHSIQNRRGIRCRTRVQVEMVVDSIEKAHPHFTRR